MTLKLEKQAELLACWREGMTSEAAQRLCGVCGNTVARYFARFAWKYGVRPRMYRRRRAPSLLPKYDGPTWIGVQITPQTKPSGPDWIGQRIEAGYRIA